MNKTVIILGASRGIGKELALKFKKEGYNVVGTYLSSHASAEELKKLNIDVIKADVSNITDVENVFLYALKKYKKIDVVINNAGISLKQKFIVDVLEEEFNNLINVNLKGVFNSTKTAVKNMLFTGGKIINVSSIFALEGGSCEAVYSATKAGVLTFSRAVAKEIEGSSLSVLSVVLGLVDTDMNKHLTNEEKLQFVKERGLKKIPTAKYVASRIYALSNKENVNGKAYKICTGKIL